MALFSRKPHDDDAATEPASTDPTADVTSPAGAAIDDTSRDAAENRAIPNAAPVPHVGISVSSYQGAIADPGAGQAFGRAAAAASVAPAGHAANGAPPTPTETLPGLVDNTILANALAAVAEQPTSKQLIDVARQLLQGMLFLRVQGDAEALAAEGKPLPLQVATFGDEQFVFAYSSGAALQASVQAEQAAAAESGEPIEPTSVMGQPAILVIARAIDSEFAGVMLDAASHPHRAILPIAVLKQAFDEITGAGLPVDGQTRIKEILCASRTDETSDAVAAALAVQHLWVAAGESPASTAENPQYGVAEARTNDGQRLLEIYTHPLEVIAMDRGDRPVPFGPAQLGEALRSDPGITGVIVDPAGPWLRLGRDQLASVLDLPAPADA